MKTLSPRERIIVLIGLCVVVVVAFTALMPNQPAGARSLATERRNGREIAAELAQARAEVADLETEIAARIVTGTPRQLVREMIQFSQEAAKKAGLEIDDLKPSELQNSPGFRRVPVQVTLSAPFPKAVRFLYELQRRPRRYQVDQLRMSAGNQQTDRLDIELQLVAFVKGDENDAGS